MIGSLAQPQARFLRNAYNRPTSEFRVSIDACPDSGSSQCKFAQIISDDGKSFEAMLDLARIPTKFLAEPNWRCVLQMRSSNLQNFGKLLGLLAQCRVQLRWPELYSRWWQRNRPQTLYVSRRHVRVYDILCGRQSHDRQHYGYDSSRRILELSPRRELAHGRGSPHNPVSGLLPRIRTR